MAKIPSATDTQLEACSPEQRPLQNSADDQQLCRLGKKPVLKRSFGFASILGFSCVILVTWEGVVLTFQTAYTEGGPAGTFYSYIVAWLGATSTCICLSELVSMAPTSGGQYHWVAMLAPRRLRRFLSYIAGWVTIAAWQATCASSALYTGLLIQGLIALCNRGYVARGWHTTLLAWFNIVFSFVINTAATTSLAKFEGLILVLHIVGFFAVLIPLVYLAPHNSAHDVFAVWLDGGHWGNRPVSFFVGLVGFVYSFAGSDSAVHMAEEVKDAAVQIPWAIIISITINGSLGFAMLIAILFCMGPPEDSAAILGTEYNYPIIQVLLDTVQSIPGSAIMISITLVLASSATVGMMATTSRLFWAFSRDRGLPFWRQISQVNRRTFVPVTAVLICSVAAGLLLLIAIGSSIALIDTLSIAVAAFFASYLISIALLFWRRVTGGIRERGEGDDFETINNSHGNLVWGPFRLPGLLGIANNAFAIVYLIIVFIFIFWPPAVPVTAATMNYACAVFGAIVLLMTLWYVVYARKVYEGPLVELPSGRGPDTVERESSGWYGAS